MSDAEHPVKARMAAGKVALGMNVRISRSGDIARIAKSSGHDFLFIDMQHGLFDVETVGHIANTALGCGVAPLVRVRSCDDPNISLLLDNGVTGIVFPDVNTADDARRGVDRAKFPPIGKRSAGGGFPNFNYEPIPVGEATARINDLTLVACMIETREGLENVEAIAAVDGVDVVHIGSNDLLVDMGKPGQFGDPEHIAAVDRVIAACAESGKVASLGGERDLGRQVEFIRKGVKFVTTQTDLRFLQLAATGHTEALREALAGGS
jgi:2-keto-3-deoxy-L-rhamnonate aldolase RhmA